MIGIDRLDQEGRIPILLEIAALIEKHEPLLEDVLVVERYLFASYNLGILGIIFGNEEAFKTSIRHLDKFGTRSHDAEPLVFERIAMLKLTRDLVKIDFPKAESSAKQALYGIKRFGKRLSPKQHVELILQLSFYYFQVAKWSEIVKLLPKFLNESPMIHDPKDVSMLWIFYVIAQHELGNFEIMKDYSVYALKYLKHHDLETEISLAILSSLRRIGSRTTAQERKDEFLRFQNVVLPDLALQENLYFARRLPFAIWVEYNLAGKKLSVAAFAANKG